MVIHHPAKFSGHRYCCSGDMMFLGVEGQDSTYLPFSPRVWYAMLSHTKFQDTDTITCRCAQW